jgi:hypothetical protein
MANANSYGLMDLIDLRLLNPTDRLQDVNADDLAEAILIDNAQHNADIAAFQRLFSETTTEYIEAVAQGGNARNQPLDEKARSIPMKPAAPYTLYYPLQGSGNAWGETWAARQKMRVRDLANVMNTLYRGDYRWVVDHIFAGLFTDDGWSHTDPIRNTSVTIEGLANGDAFLYGLNSTATAATDTHILAQAAAIADATNPFPTIYTELTEHPQNTGEVIAFMASTTTTAALAEFNSATIDSDITLGANTDRLTGSLNASLPPYTSLKGKTDSGVWIVEMPALPANYIVAITTDGPRPLARRIDPDFGDGFLVRGERDNWPLHETQLSRWEGYGGRNRVGAVVYRTGNGSYAVPTNYTSPMP